MLLQLWQECSGFSEKDRAVSRAKQHLLLVAPGNEQPSDSNIQDLISYIEYHNFQVVQSEVYSVFDLLYQQYTEARIEYLRRHPKVSAFDSENIMYGAITGMLSERPHLTFNIICHQPLRMLILGQYHIPFYRFATNGSAELEQIGQFLDTYGQA